LPKPEQPIDFDTGTSTSSRPFTHDDDSGLHSSVLAGTTKARQSPNLYDREYLTAQASNAYERFVRVEDTRGRAKADNLLHVGHRHAVCRATYLEANEAALRHSVISHKAGLPAGPLRFLDCASEDVL
jgi:hypothetical protein